MTGKHHINTSPIQHIFHHFLHPQGFVLQLVRFIGVVPGRVHNPDEPRGCRPVDLLQIGQEPPVLGRVSLKVGVGTQHDDVNTCDVEGVVEVGGGGALLVGHDPPGVVGRESGAVDTPDFLLLVVAVGHHPGALAGEGLHQEAEGVPFFLVHVGVG